MRSEKLRCRRADVPNEPGCMGLNGSQRWIMQSVLAYARVCFSTEVKDCDAEETFRFGAAGAMLFASDGAFKLTGEAVRGRGGAGYANCLPVGPPIRKGKPLAIGTRISKIRGLPIRCGLTGA